MTTQITIPASHFTPAAASPNTFASQPSFTQKILNYSISLAQGNANTPQPSSFSESQGSQSPGLLNLAGYRSRVRITNAFAPAGSTADISIWGLSQSIMNQLATLGVINASVAKNSILVTAGAASGDDASSANAATATGAGFQTIFGGSIWFSFGDYGNMPDVPFRITAHAGLFNAVQSVPPTSIQGSASVVDVMQNFANQLGIAFENNNVSGTLTNPYFPGTLLQQIYQCAQHGYFNAQIVDGGTKLAIWPLGGARTSQSKIPLISANTGMIGYPSFNGSGWLVVKMIYNPDVLFNGQIQVQSSVTQANKTWVVKKLNLALDSLLPDGEWAATAECSPLGTAAGVPSS